MLQLIISFLGGGILVALINWARTSRSERAARKHEFVKEQMTKVYGPLFFFVGITEAMFALNDKFHKAYNEHFVDQKWSTDPYTTENLKKESGATLQIANHYVNIVRENNSKIIDILRENYAYIDPEDTEIFQQFIGPDGHLKIPHLWPGQNPPPQSRQNGVFLDVFLF